MKVDKILGGDTVRVRAAGAFETADAGKEKQIKISYKLSGKDAKNYRIDKEKSQTETVADINRSSSSSTARPVLVAKGIASGKRAVKISWNNVGADRYVIYMCKCDHKGKTYQFKRVKTVKGRTLKWKKSKLSGNKAYRFCVVAQKKQGGKYKTIARSKRGHFVTGNVMGSYTNPKALKLRTPSITLSKGRSKTIKAAVTKVRKGKRLLSHEKKLRFISSDPRVAAVSSTGKVTARSKGKCTIYIQTVNGIWKICKVSVRP